VAQKYKKLPRKTLISWYEHFEPSPFTLGAMQVLDTRQKKSRKVIAAPTLQTLRTDYGITPEDYDPAKPLNEKQVAFVREWAKGESIATAALRAGYAHAEIGYKYARMANVIARYEEEKAKYEIASGMSRAKVMAQFAEAYDMGKLICDPHAMVSATREAAKMLGYYEPVKRKVDITISGNGRSRDLSVMSNEELAKLLDETPSEGLQNDLRDVIEDAVVHDEEHSDDEK
jgi:hypothetical protein